MANERQWDAVPPVLLTVSGTTEGVLQVTDTIGFFFGMQCTLKNNLGAQLTVYVKRVLNSTTMWVGPNKGGLDHNVNVSVFTIATASTIEAAMQNKSTVPIEARMLATYETDPIDAWRVRPVDPYGNGYTPSNPFPTNIVTTAQIPFTLGALTLPTLVSQYVTTLTYTEVISDTIGDEEILTFYNGSTVVGELSLTKTQDGWILNLGVPETSFLLLEDGAFFELEDGTGGILLE